MYEKRDHLEYRLYNLGYIIHQSTYKRTMSNAHGLEHSLCPIGMKLEFFFTIFSYSIKFWNRNIILTCTNCRSIYLYSVALIHNSKNHYRYISLLNYLVLKFTI
jgi:hypothetical protein